MQSIMKRHPQNTTTERCGSAAVLALVGWIARSMLLLAGAASCGDATGVNETNIQTDSTTYHLKYLPGIYWIDVKVTYTNRYFRPVYLHRACGFGDEPHRELRRTEDVTTRVVLGGPVCITRPLRPPIEVAAWATYEDHFELVSPESPFASPPITMDQRTGTFRLEYFIQSENRVEGWSAVTLVPVEQRLSNSFRVLPP
jgi:hypothetical protein